MNSTIKNIPYHFLFNQFLQSTNILMFNKRYNSDGSSSTDGGLEPETIDSDKGDEDAKAAIIYGEWVGISAPHHHHH